ncbi:MAG TPA: hypothetical protein VMI75_11690 [Polyangiaceae bacterium]|nr:hypothetical protein [Polyangiaceae bacterium]
MTPGNEEFIEVCVTLVVPLAIVVPLLRFDERRLSPKQLERAWPPVSRDAAIFAPWLLLGMPQLCLPVHAVKTRGWLWGLVPGLLVALLITFLDGLLGWGLVTALEALGL